jgi:hypothetical protein
VSELIGDLADGQWVTVALLGAYHGINPSMGWLFAVALGLQRNSRRILVTALLPIAIGHEASLVVTTVAGAVLGAFIDPHWVHPAAAVILVVFGIVKVIRPRLHPRWVGFRVSHLDLVWWSFLMATAHGAGLMLLPILFGWDVPAPHDPHAPWALVAEDGTATLMAVGLRAVVAVSLHTGTMVLAMTTVAVVVYERLGVQVLRRAWVNFDQVWAGALIVTGAMALFT